MTRHYAAMRLLEHGPLSVQEFIEITGWRANAARKVLSRMVAYNVARVIRRGVYELAP